MRIWCSSSLTPKLPPQGTPRGDPSRRSGDPLRNLPRTLHVCERHLCEDLQPVGLQRNELARMIAQDSHRVDIERSEDLCPNPVFALFASECDCLVGVDAGLTVSLDLPLVFAHLREIEQDAAAFRRDDFLSAIHQL